MVAESPELPSRDLGASGHWDSSSSNESLHGLHSFRCFRIAFDGVFCLRLYGFMG